MSNATPTMKAKKTPSDLLDERRSCMRRFEPSIPTIEDLMKHASKFGSEQVVETAAELGYGLDACIRLMDHCDRQDASVFHKARPYASLKAPKPSDVRCRLILGVEDDDD